VSQTELGSVERDVHWNVQIKWPNGAKHHKGQFASQREAEAWIKQHQWMTAERVKESDIPSIDGKGRPRKRANRGPPHVIGRPAVRAILVVLLPVLCALYLIDQYEYRGYYTNVVWSQTNSAGQQYEQELRDWRRRR
jgi:hypothetical protein